MKFEALLTIVENELGAEKDETHYELPHGKKVTILVRSGEDILPVPKVRGLNVEEDYVDIETEDGHFYVDPQAFFAVKLEDSSTRDDSRPGFH